MLIYLGAARWSKRYMYRGCLIDLYRYSPKPLWFDSISYSFNYMMGQADIRIWLYPHDGILDKADIVDATGTVFYSVYHGKD